LSHHLSHWGMTCTVAENGARALEAVKDAVHREEPFRFALFDMMMPGMDGLHLARALKSDLSTGDLTIILLTPAGSNIDDAAMKECGITCHIYKPVRPFKLYKSLIALLGEKKGKSMDFRATDPVEPRKALSIRFRGSVLLVEDNPVNLEVSQGILIHLGLEVSSARNGKEAVEAFSRKHYDLIFMDCQMPEMDGFEATRLIRTMEAARNEPSTFTPIIALTAHAMQGDREQCLNAGMDDYLTKPLTMKALEEVLERWGVERAEELSIPKAEVTNGPMPPGPQELPDPFTAEERAWDAIPSYSPVDRHVLDEVRAIKGEKETAFLDSVILLYLEGLYTDMKRLRSAIDVLDCKEIKTLAHNLKSTSAQVGAVRLSSLFKDMEMMSRNENTSKLRQVLRDVEEESKLVEEVLRKELQVKEV